MLGSASLLDIAGPDELCLRNSSSLFILEGKVLIDVFPIHSSSIKLKLQLILNISLLCTNARSDLLQDEINELQAKWIKVTEVKLRRKKGIFE